MTDHAPILTDRTFTCPACAWRAVVTTDGRVVQTQAGEFGHDHIGQAIAQLAAVRGEAARIMDHLRHKYADRAPLPSGEVLSLSLLQKLYRAVITEHTP